MEKIVIAATDSNRTKKKPTRSPDAVVQRQAAKCFELRRRFPTMKLCQLAAWAGCNENVARRYLVRVNSKNAQLVWDRLTDDQRPADKR